MKMKHVFIINPNAGKPGAAKELIPGIEKTAAAFPEESIEIYETTGPLDATRYARERAQAEQGEIRFYACGGDGTLGEVVNGINGLTNASVGCVPVGSGNDFVRNFTGPDGGFKSIENQIFGESVPIDLIAWNDSVCINMLNIGFDCDVVTEAQRLKQKPLLRGFMSYIGGIFVVLRKKYGFELSVSFDGVKQEEGEMLLLAIANGGYCGGGFHSALAARLDDGLMDAYLIHKIKRGKFLRLLPGYRTGKYVNQKAARDCVEHIRCREIELSSPELHLCSDGEVFSLTKASIRIVPSAIRFIIPRGCSFAAQKTLP